MKALVSAALFASVASFAQKATVEFDHDADFRQYRTFAVRNGQLHSKSPALNNDLVKKRITTEIERELTAKGLSISTDRPDLNVRFQLGAVRRTEVERYPAGWRGLGTRRVRVPVTEGTLVIDLRDRTNQSLVWRAVVTEEERQPAKLEGKLDKMVDKAFDKYPPKQK